MIFVNPRLGIVTGTFAVPLRVFGQSIHPLGLPGSEPVWPSAIPSTSSISGQTNTLPAFSRWPAMYPSRSRIGAHPSSGTSGPPATPVIV